MQLTRLEFNRLWTNLRIRFEPGMRQYLIRRWPLSRVDLEYLLHQIFGMLRKESWPLDLQTDDVAEHCALRLAFEWRVPAQEFEEEHAQIPVVDTRTMSLSLNHLRCEVLGRTTIREARLLILVVVGPAEIGESYAACLVNEDVFWLDISVDDAMLLVQIFNGRNALSHVLSRLLLLDFTFLL